MRAIVENDGPVIRTKVAGFSFENAANSTQRSEELITEDVHSRCEPSDETQRALRKIVDLVNVSDRSEKTIRTRLQSHGFSEDAIDESIHRAKTYGFIDDMRFADVLIRSRIAQGRGSSGIERELKDNGIEPSLIEGWPYDYDVSEETELQRALELLQKKPPSSKRKRESAYRKLAQKGFPVSVCSSAARIWAESLSE